MNEKAICHALSRVANTANDNGYDVRGILEDEGYDEKDVIEILQYIGIEE